jgi:3-oxoacyl-[acyl-carrier protein] reductase
MASVTKASNGTTLPTSSLTGLSALVTGGGRGIGRAISLQLARKGITYLAITYVGNKAAADATAAECLELGASIAISVHADLHDPDVGNKLIPAVLEGLGVPTIDIVINNAASTDMSKNEPFMTTTLKGFGVQMQANCFAPMSIIAAALPKLPPRGGRVINISSLASRDGQADPMMVYGASKAALDSITRSLALNLAAEHNVTFNSVSVGPTKTDAMSKALEAGVLPDEFVDGLKKRASAEHRIGEPEDVAMIVAWLASGESRWINGASVMAHGGDKAMVAAQG